MAFQSCLCSRQSINVSFSLHRTVAFRRALIPPLNHGRHWGDELRAHQRGAEAQREPERAETAPHAGLEHGFECSTVTELKA